jgi:hypothetical protein
MSRVSTGTPVAPAKARTIGDGIAEFSVWAYQDGATNYNPESFARLMMVHPDGTREILGYDWQNHTSIDRDENGDASTWFTVEGLDSTKCYTFELVGLIVTETEMESFAVDNRLVWDGGPLSATWGSCLN